VPERTHPLAAYRRHFQAACEEVFARAGLIRASPPRFMIQGKLLLSSPTEEGPMGKPKKSPKENPKKAKKQKEELTDEELNKVRGGTGTVGKLKTGAIGWIE
jgi:hypothetical protein